MATMKPRTLKDFRTAFDKNEQIRTRLRSSLAELLKTGSEEWRSEQELCHLSRVSTKDIPAFRPEFAAHTVSVAGANRGTDKTIWFADPKVANKVRQTEIPR